MAFLHVSWFLMHSPSEDSSAAAMLQSYFYHPDYNKNVDNDRNNLSNRGQRSGDDVCFIIWKWR